MIPIETKITRYHTWLSRQNHDRALIGLIWEADIPPLPEMLDKVGLGNPLQPEDIDPKMFAPWIETWYAQDAQLPSDTIQCFSPAFGVPWLEAMAGCTPLCQQGSIWAEPFLRYYHSRPSFGFDPENPWFRKLLEFTRALVEQSQGRFPVALPQMRGPLDTLAAMRTPQQMCLDLIDQPEAVKQVLAELTDCWIGVARALLEVIPPFHGGYSSRMKLWAPGKTITPQNDAISLISPPLYQRFIQQIDGKIINSFPYSCYHMHSTEHRHVEALLQQPNLTGIEFTLEHHSGGLPFGPSMEVARRILNQKPLVLAAPDVESANRSLAELPPAGLCVLLWTDQPSLPETHIHWVAQNRMVS